MSAAMADESQQAEGGLKRVYYEFLSDGVKRSCVQASPPAKKTCYEVSEVAPTETAFSGDAEMSFDDYFTLINGCDLETLLEPNQDPSTHHPTGSTGHLATQTALLGSNEMSADDPLGLLGTTEQTSTYPVAGLLGFDNSEIAYTQTALPGHELSFDEYFALLDRFDIGAALGTTQDTSANPLATSIGQSDTDCNLQTSVVESGKSDHSKEKENQLELQKPRGTLLAGFLNRKTAPAASANHGEGFVGTGVLVPSACDMPEFDPTAMETVDPYALPDLPGSPLSDFDPATLGVSTKTSTSLGMLARVFDPQTAKKPRGRVKRTIQQIPGFPKTTEALPPNLSLEEIASSWPNHLAYEHLEPFVEAGWNAKQICGFMPNAAKKLVPWKQLLNRISKRLFQTRREMELQGKGSVGDDVTAEKMWNNLIGVKIDCPTQDLSTCGASGNELRSTPSSATISPLPAAGQVAQYSPLAETGPSTTTKCNQSAAGGAVEALKQAFQVQLDEQADTISHILSHQDKDWIFICHLEATCRVNEVWMDQARQHEARFLRETRADATDIPIGKTNQKEMLRRLGELLYRTLSASEPSRLSTSAAEEESIFEERLLKVLQHELCILEGWTKSWKQQLHELDAAFVWDAISETAFSEIERGGQHDHVSEQMLPQTPVSQGSERCALRTEDTISTAEPAIADNDSQTSSNRASSIKQCHYGGVRDRMFPDAPSRYMNLSEHDLADKDNILRSFPEHLGLYHVMERFLAPIGSRRGFYPTNLMVDKLWHHHNGKHGSDLNHPERSKGLHDWVVSKKDGARRARQIRLGLQNKTRKSLKSDVCIGEEISDDDIESAEKDDTQAAPAEDQEPVEQAIEETAGR
jgi:hypothetical protein